MFLFLLANAIVILTALRLTGRFFASGGKVEAWLAGFILYFAQIVFSELYLGIFSALNVPNLILLNLAILLAVRFALPSRRFGFKDKQDPPEAIFRNRGALFCFALVAGFGLVKIFSNLVNPPFGWDCLNYHFTFAVEWLKSGNLNNPIVASDDPFPSYYPVNGSLWFFWLIFPFKSAFIADIGQLPFFIIALLAVYSILRKLKVSSEWSFFAACLFAFIPNFFKQLQIAYVDIMVAGLFLAALNFILALKEKCTFSNVILFALSLGLFIGTKTIALSYALFLFIPFLYVVLSAKEETARRKTGFLILPFVLAVCLGGYSYVRNIILAQNPLFPLEVAAFGKTLFKGAIDSLTQNCRNEEGAYRLAKLLFREGTGVQSLLIILPATILALPLSLLKNKKNTFFLNYLMLLPLLLYLAFRFTVPLPNTRYLYPMLGVGMITGFYCLSVLKPPAKLIKWLAVIFMIASGFECSRRMELVVSWVLSLALWLIFILFSKRKPSGKRIFSKTAVVSFIAAMILISQALFADYKKNEYMRYILNSRYWPEATAAWAWLNDHTKGENIAYVGKPVPYPLYGTDFKNNVYYVSVNRIDPIRLHDLKGSQYRWKDAEGMHRSFHLPGNYRGSADYSTWLNNLGRRNTDFLFIYSLHHTRDIAFPIEEEWAGANPDKFNPVFANETVRIYKIKK